jgi:hypothetical protein
LRWRRKASPLLGGGDKQGRQGEAGDKEGTQRRPCKITKEFDQHAFMFLKE